MINGWDASCIVAYSSPCDQRQLPDNARSIAPPSAPEISTRHAPAEGGREGLPDATGAPFTPDPAYNERHHASEFRGSHGLRPRGGNSDSRSRDQGRREWRVGYLIPINQADRPGISDAGRSFRRVGQAGASPGEATWHFFNIYRMNPARVGDRIEIDPGSASGDNPGSRSAPSPTTSIGRIPSGCRHAAMRTVHAARGFIAGDRPRRDPIPSGRTGLVGPTPKMRRRPPTPARGRPGHHLSAPWRRAVRPWPDGDPAKPERSPHLSKHG